MIKSLIKEMATFNVAISLSTINVSALSQRLSDLRYCFVLLVGILFTLNVYAEEAGEQDSIDYKLSYTYFHTKALHANDLNLRAGRDDQVLWLAGYQENPSNFHQVRTGYERTDRFSVVKVVSSLQLASHGFLGGAITAEIGAPFYAIVGYGRTNLKPYTNINFDPNDAVTLGAGWHVDQDLSVAIYGVQDNRVVDGQRITHLVVSRSFEGAQRLILDVFNKSGPPDNQGESIRAMGASITYDIAQYFMRVAYDPKVNFTQENMLRVSLGVHF